MDLNYWTVQHFSNKNWPYGAALFKIKLIFTLLSFLNKIYIYIKKQKQTKPIVEHDRKKGLGLGSRITKKKWLLLLNDVKKKYWWILIWKTFSFTFSFFSFMIFSPENKPNKQLWHNTSNSLEWYLNYFEEIYKVYPNFLFRVNFFLLKNKNNHTLFLSYLCCFVFTKCFFFFFLFFR